MFGQGVLCVVARPFRASTAAGCVPLSLQGPEELFETVSQALLSGQDRDCLAGWGAVVYVM